MWAVCAAPGGVTRSTCAAYVRRTDIPLLADLYMLPTPSHPRLQFQALLRIPRYGKARFLLSYSGFARLWVDRSALPGGPAPAGKWRWAECAYGEHLNTLVPSACCALCAVLCLPERAGHVRTCLLL